MGNDELTNRVNKLPRLHALAFEYQLNAIMAMFEKENYFLYSESRDEFNADPATFVEKKDAILNTFYEFHLHYMYLKERLAHTEKPAAEFIQLFGEIQDVDYQEIKVQLK